MEALAAVDASLKIVWPPPACDSGGPSLLMEAWSAVDAPLKIVSPPGLSPKSSRAAFVIEAPAALDVSLKIV